MRNAAGVTFIRSRHAATAYAYLRLVSCLPSLERVELSLVDSLVPDNLACLLDALLVWCPRLVALDVRMMSTEENDVLRPFPDIPAAVWPRSLTKLSLSFNKGPLGVDPCILAGVASALVPLAGLAELSIDLHPSQRAVVPAALGQLKGLQALQITGFSPCVLEAGCFELPSLLSLHFRCCGVGDAEVLPGVTSLQSLTRLTFSGGCAPPFFDHQLVQLPVLKYMAFETYSLNHKVSGLPADMGSLSSSLLHLDFRGHMLTEFPLALTQLVALQCLKANRNDFAELPACITALSSLTELWLGRNMAHSSILSRLCNRSFDARALGDLSGFPTLCKLVFDCCEVKLCESIAGAVRHASLTGLCFCIAYPAPECAPMVLQLSQALRRNGRGSVLKLAKAERGCNRGTFYERLLHTASTPVHSFKVALEASRL